MRRKFVIWGVSGCAAALLVVPTAFAATPQQIYRDYAQHGRLTQSYSRGDLLRAQRDSALQGYPRVGVQGAIARAFTGLDLALMSAGGVLLLGAGAGLRRLGRAQA